MTSILFEGVFLFLAEVFFKGAHIIIFCFVLFFLIGLSKSKFAEKGRGGRGGAPFSS